MYVTHLLVSAEVQEEKPGWCDEAPSKSGGITIRFHNSNMCCVVQEQVEMEKEKRRRLLEDNRRFQEKRDEMYQLYLNKKQEQELQGFTFF